MRACTSLPSDGWFKAVGSPDEYVGVICGGKG